jgi:mannose-6-phosphate isomerase-like protein (cupin superfamily)
MKHQAGFSVRHASDARFERGLRAAFEYRDLGVSEATGGRVTAHVIRALPGQHVTPQLHHHETEFQIFYVLRGWVTFRYESIGEVTLSAGSCVHQPAGLRHLEVAHSEDVEILEVVAPAGFRTVEDR